MADWKAIAVLASAVLVAMPAAAQQVATTTAVNPASEGAPPGGSATTLTVGAHIVHNEHVRTSSSGSVQLLFVDKSSMSIGPNSSIVIDEFVYDPNANSGHMLATLTKGALRYVGGELSHQGEVTIKTSNATIGIRGGTATVIQGPEGTTVINHFGTITIENGATQGAGPIIVTRGGFVVTITGWNIPPGQPAQVTAAEIARYLKYLTSQFGQNGGGNFNNFQTFACGIGTSATCPQPPWLSTNTGENNAFQIIVQATHQATSQPPPPPPPCYWYWSRRYG